LPLKCISPESGETEDGACCPGFFLTPEDYNCDEVLCPPEGWYDNHPEIVTDNPACITCASDPSACFDMEQAMWTDHCLQDGDATFPPSLTKTSSDLVVQKGMNKFVDPYSAFMENTQTLQTTLSDEIQSRDVDTIYVVGIATDVFLQATVRDALSALTSDSDVIVIQDATAAVMGDEANFNAAIAEMRALGATITTVSEVLDTECPSSGPGVGGCDTEGCTNIAASSMHVSSFLVAAAVAMYAFV